MKIRIRSIKKFIKATVRLFFVIFLIGVVALFIYGHRVTFNGDFAHILYSDSGTILHGMVSQDEQWRIKCDHAMPDKLSTCVRLFEDEYFYWHPGINPVSLTKAFWANIRAGSIKRGGSTITMQLARIHLGNQERTYVQKLKEIILALALEMRYSKKFILQKYGQYAPFGGNIIGYSAAAHKYYGKPPEFLTWSEAAMLAVLPNAPGQIYPGNGREKLLKKRNFVLHKLLEKNYLDSTSYEFSLREEIPSGTLQFPQIALHTLVSHMHRDQNIRTTLSSNLQRNTAKILHNYSKLNTSKSVHNSSAIILDNKTGNVKAYIGNVDAREKSPVIHVDMNTSLRSPGSTLKPFLYAYAIDGGLISSSSLLEDLPLFYRGFSPQNFDQRYRGMVRADQALRSSLNIPAVALLDEYGIQAFIENLKDLGLKNTYRDQDWYGLSLILGGNEVKPINLAQAYMNLARKGRNESEIGVSLFSETNNFQETSTISSSAALEVINILKESKRPEGEDGWQFFAHHRDLAWKTGTSYGHRDAWAVGVTPNYTILVWVGNSSGEGRPGLTGLRKAAPILFKIAEILPNETWFEELAGEVRTIQICPESGYKKSRNCPVSTKSKVPRHSKTLKLCEFHQTFTLERSTGLCLSHECWSDKESLDTSLFILPPRHNMYYQKATGISHSAPKAHPDCNINTNDLAIVYPPNHAKILFPKDLDGETNSVIFRASSAAPRDTLFWFVDEEFKEITTGSHHIQLDKLREGTHQLSVNSIEGAVVQRSFEVVSE